MSIRPEADDYYFQDFPEERAIAVRLQEAFDVTHGEKVDKLSYWLLRPHPNTRERFGLQKEILCIYSRHSSTDARVLTTIERLLRRPDLRHRVDKVVFLVIHSGDHEEARSIVSSDREKVVIAIGTDELPQHGVGDLFVRSRLSEVLGSIDLFGMSSPIVSDSYFFGRSTLVQRLSRRLFGQRQNAGLFGLRKTGKTSVLFAIRRGLENQSAYVEYLDCQSPGIHGARWWQVLGNISSRLDAANRKHDGKPSSGPYSPETAASNFGNDIKRLLQTDGVDHILIMFDEIEWITPSISGFLGRHWDDDFLPFWQTIRATHQETEGRLTFLVAGVNPACVNRPYFGSTPNPIFQLASPSYLEPFSESTVRDMIRSIGRYAGLRFKDAAYSTVQDLYGGHPYLIRIACSEIWQDHRSLDSTRIAEIGPETFTSSSTRIRVRLSQPIKDILLSLVWWYPDEYALLQILADGDVSFVQQYMKESPDSVIQFAQYGLLRSDGQFAISEIREFLCKHGEVYRQELSPFSRSDVDPDLLPISPDLKALGRLFQLKSELETKLRKVIVMYLGVQFGWKPAKIATAMSKGMHKRSDRPDPSALFVGRTPQQVANELYVTDMKSIIVENWEVFRNVFDDNRARFEMNMDGVNVARQADGHTRPTSAEEIDAFENSYQWLLARLRPIPIDAQS